MLLNPSAKRSSDTIILMRCHCERSEAISCVVLSVRDCRVAALLAMTPHFHCVAVLDVQLVLVAQILLTPRLLRLSDVGGHIENGPSLRAEFLIVEGDGGPPSGEIFRILLHRQERPVIKAQEFLAGFVGDGTQI